MLKEHLQEKIDTKTKPVGSLGKLESIALQIGLIQQTKNPKLHKPTLLVFAGDHGVARSGVSAYPPEVTPQMVLNFLAGGAAINVFCKQNEITLNIVDSGVNGDFPDSDDLINAKIRKGTHNFLEQQAMSAAELDQCFSKASDIIERLHNIGCNVVGFGEMGIGNTSSASMIMSQLCSLPIDECVGRGTGLDDEGLNRKISILKDAHKRHGKFSDPKGVLATYGGFEIAQMCGGMLAAYEKEMIIMVDGFISTAAYLAAVSIQPDIKQNAIFSHQSDEKAHKKLLSFLEVSPILNLNLRLGEGTGCALAYPIIKNAVAFLNDMTSFESAKVTGKNS